MNREPFGFPKGSTVYVADTEANGYLDEATSIHSLVIRDFWTGELKASYVPGYIEQGVELLEEADFVLFHNGLRYDYPLLVKLAGLTLPEERVIDTLVWARLCFPPVTKEGGGGPLADWDRKLQKTGRLEGKDFGGHSLRAWGIRLGVQKLVFGTGEIEDFAQWSPEMQAYCEQDTLVNQRLAWFLYEQQFSQESVELEMALARLLWRMEQNGVVFDEQKAVELYAQLSGRRADLTADLQNVFPPQWVYSDIVEPKPRRRWTTTVEGAQRRRVKPKGQPAKTVPGYWTHWWGPYQRIDLQHFNPGSRQQVAARLKKTRGWLPSEFTPSGEPKIDDDVLNGLPYPEAKLLAEYYMVQKRIAQLAEGDEAWLKHLKGGKIHGTILGNGCITGRAAHKKPNLAQVPANDAPYGEECRACFTVPDGWGMLGSDQRKLELICLAHYLGRYDKGNYKRIVTRGDPHTFHQQAVGLPTRKGGKTFGYAYIYGGGNYKLGSIAPDPPIEEVVQWRLGKLWSRAQRAIKKQGRAQTDQNTARWVSGLKLRERFQKYIPGLGKLKSKVDEQVDKQGFIYGLDGRKIFIRSRHSDLNALLQSAGALVCKKWLILIEQILLNRGLKHGWDGDFVMMLWVHDEAQLAFRSEHRRLVEKACKVAAKIAGDHFGLRAPTRADVKVGKNWSETH